MDAEGKSAKNKACIHVVCGLCFLQPTYTVKLSNGYIYTRTYIHIQLVATEAIIYFSGGYLLATRVLQDA